MCIIVYKPYDVELPSLDTMKKCWESNAHGAGIMYPMVNKKLAIRKGLMTWKDFEEFYKAEMTKETTFVAHFRIRTHGESDAENTHPFWIDEDALGIAHNGILPMGRILSDKCKQSDTSAFASEILAKLPKGWHTNPFFLHFIEEYMGASNKLVIMDKLGKATIINKTAGTEEGGCWYSNTSFRRYTYTPSTPYSYTPRHDDEDWGSSAYRHNHSVSSDAGTRTPRGGVIVSGPGSENRKTEPDLLDISRSIQDEHTKLVGQPAPVNTCAERERKQAAKARAISEIWKVGKTIGLTNREMQQLAADTTNDRITPMVIHMILEDLKDGVDLQENLLAEVKDQVQEKQETEDAKSAGDKVLEDMVKRHDLVIAEAKKELADVGITVTGSTIVDAEKPPTLLGASPPQVVDAALKTFHKHGKFGESVSTP